MSTTRDDYKKVPLEEMRARPNPLSAVRVGDDETLYDALDRMGLLLRSNISGSGYLVREGEIGLSSDNGKPRFHATGRHRCWSPLHAWKGVAKASDRMIRHGDKVQIVTVDASEIGLCKANGKNIILEPGQHILVAPLKFIEAKKIDSDYVMLGTHHRISVPIGKVAVADNEGRKIMITPEHLEVDEHHKGYIHNTNGAMFTIDSPTFKFNPETGFKSIQLEDIQLNKLVVNTAEMIALSVVGSVRYKISDPVKAFLMTEDVEGDIIKQAYATLTSVFSQLSVDEIASSLASTNISTMKGKEEHQIPHDMLHHATDIFMKEFQAIVKTWGVDAVGVNITSMELQNEAYRKTIQSRAEQRMAADTKLAVIEAQTNAELQEAERVAKISLIQARAEAERIKMLADAEVYAAQKRAEAAGILAKIPLAAELSVMDAQAKVAAAYGDKTVFTSMPVTGMSLRQGQNQTFFLGREQGRQEQMRNDAAQQLDADAQSFKQGSGQ